MEYKWINGIYEWNGNTNLYDNADPSSIIGVDGDHFINSSTNKIFGPKPKVWPVGISLVGPRGLGGAGFQGPAGVTGAAIQTVVYKVESAAAGVTNAEVLLEIVKLIAAINK